MLKSAVLLAAVALASFAVGHGVYNAQAQGAPTLVATAGYYYAIDSTGRLLRKAPGEPAWRVIGQAPSGSPVSLEAHGQTQLIVGMENGDLYLADNILSTLTPPAQFTYSGNVFEGAVANDGGSWSKVKGSYSK